MVKKIFVLLVLVSIFLAACSSTPAGQPVEAVAENPGETEAIPTEIPPSPEMSPSPDNTQAVNQAEANCTVVSRQPTPGPTEQSLIPPVSDEDWILGPDDASVTFIEYGDFQ